MFESFASHLLRITGWSMIVGGLVFVVFTLYGMRDIPANHDQRPDPTPVRVPHGYAPATPSTPNPSTVTPSDPSLRSI